MCSMFHGFGSGVLSSSARQTHPGWQTCVTQKGPSQRGESLCRPANLCYPERTLPAGGESLCRPSQIIHLEPPTMHKPLVIALERLAVQCISESCLPSCFLDQVDIIML
jgi:hypothetical protein